MSRSVRIMIALACLAVPALYAHEVHAQEFRRRLPPPVREYRYEEYIEEEYCPPPRYRFSPNIIGPARDIRRYNGAYTPRYYERQIPYYPRRPKAKPKRQGHRQKRESSAKRQSVVRVHTKPDWKDVATQNLLAAKNAAQRQLALAQSRLKEASRRTQEALAKERREFDQRQNAITALDRERAAHEATKRQLENLQKARTQTQQAQRNFLQDLLPKKTDTRGWVVVLVLLAAVIIALGILLGRRFAGRPQHPPETTSAEQEDAARREANRVSNEQMREQQERQANQESTSPLATPSDTGTQPTPIEDFRKFADEGTQTKPEEPMSTPLPSWLGSYSEPSPTGGTEATEEKPEESEPPPQTDPQVDQSRIEQTRTQPPDPSPNRGEG